MPYELIASISRLTGDTQFGDPICRVCRKTTVGSWTRVFADREAPAGQQLFALHAITCVGQFFSGALAAPPPSPAPKTAPQ